MAAKSSKRSTAKKSAAKPEKKVKLKDLETKKGKDAKGGGISKDGFVTSW